MRVERLTRPTADIIQLDHVKEQARIDGPDEDALIGRMIPATVIEAEDYGQIALLSQRVRVTLHHWPRSGLFAPPIGPLMDAASVTVTVDGAAFTGFAVDTGSRALLHLTGDYPRGRVVIEYTAGFGETAADIPADILQALTDQVAVLIDARGMVEAKDITLSPQFIRVLGRYRGVRL